ncbi:MAG: DUF4177 domain-containing protein [Pirellulaceae bacterium]|nr:DUF4177 domain-containing protein [Pirellulaceae bacterium]
MTKVVTIKAQQKWEFCFESRKTEPTLVKTLNDLGQQGWELVTIIHHKDPKGIMTWTAFMKRPSIPQQQPAAEPQPNLTVAKPLDENEPAAGKGRGFDLSGDEFKLKEEPAPPGA